MGLNGPSPPLLGALRLSIRSSIAFHPAKNLMRPARNSREQERFRHNFMKIQENVWRIARFRE